MFPFWPGYLVFFVFSIFVTFIFPPFYEQMLRLNMCCSERDVDSPASETELATGLIESNMLRSAIYHETGYTVQVYTCFV